MWPMDNNTQPGTGKNARRMCLRHQTIQYFCVIGTKIEKGKKERGKKIKSLKFLGFLDRVSVEGNCKVGWPWTLGGAWHQGSCSPGCSARALGFSCALSSAPLPGLSHVGNTEELCWAWHFGGCPNEGLLETPGHPLHSGERSHAQECCVSPEKPLLEVVAGGYSQV